MLAETSEMMLYLKRQLAQSPHTKITGYLGERIVLETMRQNKRWFVYQPSGAKTGDLHFVSRATGETVKIEVKTARPASDGRYHFCLRKLDNHGATSIDYAQYVLLLCIGLSGLVTPFFVPVRAFKRGQKHCGIGANPRTGYTGKFAKYRISSTLSPLPLVE